MTGAHKNQLTSYVGANGRECKPSGVRERVDGFGRRTRTKPEPVAIGGINTTRNEISEGIKRQRNVMKPRHRNKALTVE